MCQPRTGTSRRSISYSVSHGANIDGFVDFLEKSLRNSDNWVKKSEALRDCHGLSGLALTSIELRKPDTSPVGSARQESKIQ